MELEYSRKKPMFLIINVEWAQLWVGEWPWYYKQYPIKDIIEDILSVDRSSNNNLYDLLLSPETYELIYENLLYRFEGLDEDQFDAVINYTLALIDRIFCNIWVAVRNYTRNMEDDNADYVFHKWMDKHSLVLKKIKDTDIMWSVKYDTYNLHS